MKHGREAKPRSNQKGFNRRQFLTSMGASGALLAAGTRAPAAATKHHDGMVQAGDMTRINLLINGHRHSLLVEPRWSLLYVLREKLGFTGTKEGCGRGECGACTVLIDGVPRYSCLTLAVEVEGSEITTVEGLMKGEELGPVQQAFLEHDAYQCGYCTPGQIMAVEGLLRANHDPSAADIRTGVSGNLCRCGAYTHIFNAAQKAARLKGGKK